MPQLPSRACRCGATVPGGARCAACTRSRQRATDERRGSAHERGYTAAWRAVRVRAFIRDAWKCTDCAWEPDVVRLCRDTGLDSPPAAVVLNELRQRKLANQRHLHGDHVETIADRPDRRLDAANVATRCDVCHARRTAREHGAFGNDSK